MQASAYLKSKVFDDVRDSASAADRPLRPVEPGEEAVPGGVELVSAVADELPPDQRVMLLKELALVCGFGPAGSRRAATSPMSPNTASVAIAQA
jgi:hypothetical protein